MSEIPKMTLVSSSRGQRVRAHLRGWGRSLRTTLRRFLWTIPVAAVSASGLWGVSQISACIDREEAACKTHSNLKLEVIRLQRNTDGSFYYYAFDRGSSELLGPYGPHPARIFLDVPPDGRPYVITRTRYSGWKNDMCHVSIEAHLRTTADMDRPGDLK